MKALADSIPPSSRAARATRTTIWPARPTPPKVGLLSQIPVQPTKRGLVPMHEIICPHCNKAFKIDEAGYADILKQVRDGDFDKQLHERLELAEREKRDAIA